MIRNVNINGLKNQLAENAGGGYNVRSSEAGEADGKFNIHLKNGRYYPVKKGYWLSWGKGRLLIKEATFSTKDLVNNKDGKDKSLLESVFDIGLAILAVKATEKNAHEVILEWHEVENIDSI